jgi:hypothetical protein
MKLKINIEIFWEAEKFIINNPSVNFFIQECICTESGCGYTEVD